MHFSIPETVQLSDESGEKYWSFGIHVNGVQHCRVRYSQLDKFNETIKKEFPDRVPAKLFPGKKLFALNNDQLEERREQLEKYMQYISQDPIIGISDAFNEFFVKAQQETRLEPPREVPLDIYLMNGNKVSLTVMTTDQTDEVLEETVRKIGLPEKFCYYFALFMVERDDNGSISIVRKLQDFESPYLSLAAADRPHRIVIRKNYWSSKYDDDLLEDRIAMNLLYVQAVDDIDRGWLLCSDAERVQMNKLQDAGSRKEVVQLARTMKYYGYVHFRPCRADYPKPDSTVLMAAGDREFNVRIRSDVSKVMEGSFRVQKIRSWRLTSVATPDGGSKEKLLFAFEYLFGKDELRWITIESSQAIMMSMAMQGMVDEILREQQGTPIRTPKGVLKQSDSSLPLPQNVASRATSSGNRLDESVDGENSSVAKKISNKVQNLVQNKKNVGQNEIFAADDIGDEDL